MISSSSSPLLRVRPADAFRCSLALPLHTSWSNIPAAPCCIPLSPIVTIISSISEAPPPLLSFAVRCVLSTNHSQTQTRAAPSHLWLGLTAIIPSRISPMPRISSIHLPNTHPGHAPRATPLLHRRRSPYAPCFTPAYPLHHSH